MSFCQWGMGEGRVRNLIYQPRSRYQPTLTQIQVQGLKFYKTLSRRGKSEHKRSICTVNVLLYHEFISGSYHH